MRIQQEIDLGMAGTKLVKALGLEPEVYHMNEGHSSFLLLELIRQTINEKQVSFNIARDIVTAKTAFTTHTPVPVSYTHLVKQKIASGKTVEIEQKRKSIFASFMTGFVRFLPTLIMLGMAYLIFEMQGVGKKGKVYDPEVSNNDVKFDDVAGLDEEKNEMIEIIDFLKNPDKYKEMGAKVPHGVLFSGKPGTGKTLIAKAIACLLYTSR